MFLNENGVKCVNLNGRMALNIRTGKLNSFQSGDVDVISCTDIGSRGINTVRVSASVMQGD
jgi:superfamily II DNA/RNA helicase